MLNILVLTTSCIIALIRPVAGLGLLLFFEATLFCLGANYARVATPVGNIGPMNVLILCLLIGTTWRNTLLPGRKTQAAGCPDHTPALADRRKASNTLRSAIIAYVAWLLICQAIGLVQQNYLWYPESLKGVLRFNLESTLPWALVWVVYTLPERASRTLMRTIIVLMTLTAVCHVAISVFDLRSIVMYAYYDPIVFETPIYRWRRLGVTTVEIVRAWPQGVMLMIYLLVFLCCGKLVGNKIARGPWITGVIASLLVALLVTVTRVFIGLSFAGVALGTLLALRAKGVKFAPLLMRACGVATVLGGILALFVLSRPAFAGYWLERLTDLSSDSRIFSRETSRGLNNIAALNAIAERPVLGYGLQDYPGEFTVAADSVDGLHSDIHAFLAIVLSSGIPGLFLFLRLHWIVVKRLCLGCKHAFGRQGHLLPYATVILLSLLANSSGAAGGITGRALFPVVLFIGFMAREYRRASRLTLAVSANLMGETPRASFRA